MFICMYCTAIGHAIASHSLNVMLFLLQVVHHHSLFGASDLFPVTFIPLKC